MALRRFVTPFLDGGLPVTLNEFGLLQELAESPLAGLLSNLGNLVLSGCTVSNVNTATSTLQISPGLMYLGGSVVSFDGYSGTYPVYCGPAASEIQNREYKDNQSRPAFEIKKVATSPVVIANSILFNPDTTRRYNAVVQEAANGATMQMGTDIHSIRQSGNYAIHSAVNGVSSDNWAYYEVIVTDPSPNNLYLKVIAYSFFNINQVWTKTCAGGGWTEWTRLATGGDLVNLQNQINANIASLQATDASLQGQINGKASNSEENWVDVTIPGTDFGSVAKVRKDNAGWVHIKHLYLIRSTGDGATSNGMILPVGYRPAQDEYFTVTGRVTINNATGSWFHTFITFKIQPDGGVYFDYYENDRANGYTTSTPPANYVLSFSGPGNYKGQ